MVRGLVPSMSDMSIEPFWYDYRMVPTWSDIRAISILGMEVHGMLPGILGLGMRAILIWLWDLFSHDQMWAHGHYNVIEGCVPTWSDIRVVSILLKNGGTWLVTKNPQPRVESLSIMVAGCIPAWVDVSVELFHHGCRMCSHMGERVEPF